MNNVILNVSTGGYIRGAERLRNTLLGIGEFKGDLLFFTDESQINAPKHLENPYAFKTYAFNYAINLGYKKILWLDSSVYAIKQISKAWEIIEQKGFIMQYAGHNCGTWSNDNCLEYFGIDRNQAMEMPMYGNAGLLGLDMEKDICNIFLDKWHKSALDGIFKGSWNNNNNTESNDTRCKGHRHDMSAGSIIANQLGMNNEFLSTLEILQYASPEEAPINESIIFKAQGI
jgi:hypothetical protein